MGLLEGLQKFFEWLKDINWALSLLAAIPLSIVANMITPKVQNWFGRRSGDKARKRIDELEHELDNIEKFIENKENFYLYLVRQGFIILMLLGIGNLVSSIIPIISGVFGSIFYLIAINKGLKSAQLIENVTNFDSYKDKINAQIIEMRSSENVSL